MFLEEFLNNVKYCVVKRKTGTYPVKISSIEKKIILKLYQEIGDFNKLKDLDIKKICNELGTNPATFSSHTSKLKKLNIINKILYKNRSHSKDKLSVLDFEVKPFHETEILLTENYKRITISDGTIFINPDCFVFDRVLVQKRKSKLGVCDISLPYKVIGNKPVYEKIYKLWLGILGRCYKSKEEIPCYSHKSYKNTRCCEDWLYYSKFKAWVEQQDWEGKQLDKDLLGDYHNKIYSPETCCFISNKLNTFLTNKKWGEELPTGVSISNKERNLLKNKPARYVACIGDMSGKVLKLGLFDTPEEAHKRWQIEKLKYLNMFIDSEQDTRVKNGLILKRERLEYHITNNKILEYF